MLIREVFDKTKPIDRRIEKVITYETSNDDLLKQEIQEYVATESIEAHFERLLDQMQYGMSNGQNPEIGVWVSGFYGSGKSSFTKYLGFALDPDKKIDGKPFLELLQNQIKSASLRTRFAVMAKRFPTVVIMLDLATEQLSGATMAEISSVLYAKVMQWAGYSRDEKIAYLEFMLERDGKLDAFKERISGLANGKSWDEIKNQPLVMRALAARAAVEFYPEIFPDTKTFNEIKIEERIKENDRVKEMLDLIRRHSGAKNIIFVIDEVGQYVASRDELILNLDGLAKNIKAIGRGQAWIVATAQQTLTEDDPRAAINTAKLFKLKDRFPLSIDLEASDIKEICYTRLLSKSKAGQESLEKLYDQHGPQLRYVTQLNNTKYYHYDLDKTSFCKFYPFLPVHFDILLQLLSRLAKTRGGIGLRSAIKVLQDVLVDASHLRVGSRLLADASVGELANSVVFYDALHKDIEKPFPHIITGVAKVVKIFGEESMQTRVAKSVAVLQILEDFPVSRENVAALLHPSITSSSFISEVNSAVEDLLKEKSIPLNEVDGSLRFMSEAVIDLEVERMKYSPRIADLRNVENTLLREIFSPLPTVRLLNSRMVSSGIKIYSGAMAVPLLGDREEIQTHIDLVSEKEYENRKQERLEESRQRQSQNIIYFLGHRDAEIETVAVDVLRSREIFTRNRNKAADKDVEEYLRAQNQRADQLEREIQLRLKKALTAGSFIFRGQLRPAGGADLSVTEALRGFLDETAVQVFHKFSEAPVSTDTTTAERFLKTEHLNRIASQDDPLNLIKKSGSTTAIEANHRALTSIRDYLEQNGQVDGRKFLDDFYAAPYGWSKDTSRYLIAAMLVAGLVKLRISGQDITVRGETALNNLKNTNNFNKIGIYLREDRPNPEVLQRARMRLLELTGEDVMPLQEEISKCVMRTFPDLQRKYAGLVSQLQLMSLPGGERAENLQINLSEILKGDASDAAVRLGGESCSFYDDLGWAHKINAAFKNGMDILIRQALLLSTAIEALPDAGIPAELASGSKMVRDQLGEYIRRDDFFDFAPQIRQQIDDLNQQIAATVQRLKEDQSAYLDEHKKRLQRMPEWNLLGQEESARLSSRMDALTVEAQLTLEGLKHLINNRYALSETITQIEREIREVAAKRDENGDEDIKRWEFDLPGLLTSSDDLDRILQELESMRQELSQGKKIKIIWH